MLKNSPSILSHHHVGIFACAVIMLGMVLSRSLMSAGMILLLLNAVINKNVKAHFKYFFSNKALLATTSIFFLYLVSGLWSEDVDYWWKRVLIKVPFLILPFSFVALKGVDVKKLQGLLCFFLALFFGTAVWVLLNHFVGGAAANYHTGQVIEMPFSHVRFSLIVAFAVGTGMWLLEKEFVFRYKWERYFQAFAVLFLVVFLHVVAVRSGLLALYLLLAFAFVRYIFVSKKYWIGALVLAAFVGFTVVAFSSFPFLKDKVRYMKYSLELYAKGEVNNDLSDAKRISSILVGIEVGKSHFILGTGLGDIKTETAKIYTEKYPKLAESNPLPHNQFVMLFAATGVLGLALFCVAIFLPLFYQGAFRHPLLLGFHLVILTSFMTETTLEAQLGTAFYLLFMGILNQIRTSKEY